MDLMATNVSKLIRDIKTGSSLGCNDADRVCSALLGFAVLRDLGQVKLGSRILEKQTSSSSRTQSKGSPGDKGVE